MSFSAGGGGPSGANGTTEGSFDSSNWSVAMGSGSSTATSTDDGGPLSYLKWGAAAFAVLIAIKLWKRK